MALLGRPWNLPRQKLGVRKETPCVFGGLGFGGTTGRGQALFAVAALLKA
jgi:hypothetical protein